MPNASILPTTTAALSITSLALVAACATAPPASDKEPATTAPAEKSSSLVIISPSEVEWQQLNPARDTSPKAGTLWGDRDGDVATGYLLRPTDGFESPPHIHNVSYRAVVIRGLIHNDAPEAEKTWMPAGSYWTQPKGGVHITAAMGSDTMAYIEIDEGPYLVRPVEEAFESDDQLVNIDASKIAWTAIEGSASQTATLWGDPRGGGPGGMFVKIKAGSAVELRQAAPLVFRAVAITGQPTHQSTTIEPGSFITTKGDAVELGCAAGEDCVLYVRLEGELTVTPK